MFPDPGVHIIRHRLIISILIDVSLIQHRIEHHLSALFVVLRIGDGIICGRVLGDSGDYGGLDERQITD